MAATAPPADDDSLMRRTRNGDREALAALYERYWRQLYQFVHRWTNDGASAEDLVQDLFLKLLDPRLPYSPGPRFDVWLFRVARNLVIDRHRRLRDDRSADLEVVTDPDPGALAAVIANEDSARLERALAAIAPAHREAILLRNQLDLSHDELARELRCTPGAARVRLHRALTALRTAWLTS